MVSHPCAMKLRMSGAPVFVAGMELVNAGSSTRPLRGLAWDDRWYEFPGLSWGYWSLKESSDSAPGRGFHARL